MFIRYYNENMKVLIIILILFVLESEERIFTRCKLAKELSNIKLIERTFLGNWVCLIEKVSKRDTSAFVVTPSGRKYYGLYQIPSKWCRVGKKGGDCNIACESLLDDDIRDDTACAVAIFHKEGFKYWTKWTTGCKKNNLITNEIYKCPELVPRISPERDILNERLKIKRSHKRRRGIQRWKNNHYEKRSIVIANKTRDI